MSQFAPRGSPKECQHANRTRKLKGQAMARLKVHINYFESELVLAGKALLNCMIGVTALPVGTQLA